MRLTCARRRFWALTISGYAVTVVAAPLLGVATTLVTACALVIAERVGKPVRSPARSREPRWGQTPANGRQEQL